ncbi:MAG: alpha/beta fold hydrolase [Solirubrobacterales bacterium]
MAGTGTSGAIWNRDQVPHFADRYTCITFDLRGAGQSEAPPGPYSVAQMATDAVGLVEALGIERAQFVGLSLGSAILQELALARPDLVERMVLLSTWSSTPTEHHIKRWFEARLATLRRAPRSVFAAYGFWMWAPSFVDDEHAAMAELGEFFLSISGEQPLHAYEAHFEADLGHNTIDRLGSIACPTLILYGEEDLITLPRYNERVRAAIPGAQARSIPGAGHLALVERPAAVNSAIADFIV